MWGWATTNTQGGVATSSLKKRDGILPIAILEVWALPTSLEKAKNSDLKRTMHFVSKSGEEWQALSNIAIIAN